LVVAKINVSASSSLKPETWKFSDLLADPAVRARWEKVRRYFYLRESTYDMSNRCNLRCDGCYYYEGDKQFAAENRDPDAWRALMRGERARGITYAVLAGAEPALAPDLLRACFAEMPLGCIATNGATFIPGDIGYKIHISVWGNDRTSEKLRGARNLLSRQLANYENDPRAVFIYTFTHGNCQEARETVEAIAARGGRVSFNVFSPTVGYEGPLRHTPESLREVRSAMLELLQEFPQHVLYSKYNAVAHTSPQGLHELFACPYPRVNPSTDIGLGRSFRQYRTDLTWDRDSACCVPDTDCRECRHYAAGSAIVTSRLVRHAKDPDAFKAWLDYVDIYLATWVIGYEKGDNLQPQIVFPPGRKAGGNGRE
jgi:MoaA/NifB/PqqE/SkfB family radical SAM enzyme